MSEEISSKNRKVIFNTQMKWAIERLNTNKFYEEKLREDIINILENIPAITLQGRRSKVILAAILNLAAKLEDIYITRKKICRILNVSELSTRTIERKIERVLQSSDKFKIEKYVMSSI